MSNAGIFRAFIGTEFTAKDKLGQEYHYRAVGFNSNDTSREFKLLNLTNGTLTEVEEEWFHQRKIIIQ